MSLGFQPCLLTPISLLAQIQQGCLQGAERNGLTVFYALHPAAVLPELAGGCLSGFKGCRCRHANSQPTTAIFACSFRQSKHLHVRFWCVGFRDGLSWTVRMSAFPVSARMTSAGTSKVTTMAISAESLSTKHFLSRHVKALAAVRNGPLPKLWTSQKRSDLSSHHSCCFSGFKGSTPAWSVAPAPASAQQLESLAPPSAPTSSQSLNCKGAKQLSISNRSPSPFHGLQALPAALRQLRRSHSDALAQGSQELGEHVGPSEELKNQGHINAIFWCPGANELQIAFCMSNPETACCHVFSSEVLHRPGQ